MTVYNDLRFLDEAVDSILAQDFHDFELIIVDDGTGERATFNALAERDPRIRVVANPVNIGTAAAANHGIDRARADIILRLDADDVAEPTHIGRLVDALAQDPQLALVGSAVTWIDENNQRLDVQPMPETDVDVRWTILFHNPFYHSAVAYRRGLFEAAGRYIPEELVSQDHYLWFNLLPLGRARNLAEPLTRYRVNSRGLTASHLSKNPRGRTHAIRAALWSRIGLSYDLYDDVLAGHVSHFLRGHDIAPPEGRAAAYRTILKVLRAFLTAPRPFPRDEDAEAERRLKSAIITRIWNNPPRDHREVAAIFRLCMLIDVRATIGAIGACLALSLRRRWQTARIRLM
jgi:glycosyltransferase involved in cell wall biosynthesis